MRRGRSAWALGGILLGACATAIDVGPPQPIDSITVCDRSAVLVVPRPQSPRTPVPSLLHPRCDGFRAFRIDGAPSNAARDTTGFLAGFAKADITPPPGLGTLGWGPEARVARGFRNRLKARAMVLEDASGEIVALAVADLDAISSVLYRTVASRVYAETDGAIGADRLVLSATHTHSGPGNFLTAWPINLIGSPVPGFDYAFVQWLGDRIAGAVVEAYRGMRPARAAWGVRNVWGATRNRIPDAHRSNPDVLSDLVSPPGPAAPAGLAREQTEVNPRWVMLRVETRDGDTWQIAGTYSVFSVHGTVIPRGNELYDADLQGAVTRELERQLGGVHILANGTEGDVSPTWSDASRCPLPRMAYYRRPGGPRGPQPVFDWVPTPDDTLAVCLEAALADLERLTGTLSAAARDLYASIADLSPDVHVARRFETVHLTGPAGRSGGLCGRPQAGMALAAGAADGTTRFKGWRVFGLWPLGVDWGEDATDEQPLRCQSPKRVLVPALQAHPVASLQFPEWTHFTVLRIGTMWLGTVPAEATTVAGRQMMTSLRRGVARHRGVADVAIPSDSLAIIGLANGYLSYVTTWYEYQAQTYEGGSTLYGPHSAAFIAGRLERLGASFGAAGPQPVATISVRPGPNTTLLAGPGTARGPATFADTKATAACAPEGVETRWIDSLPGAFQPADGPMVRFSTRSRADGVEDDDTRVEVWREERRGAGLRWVARWRPQAALPPHTVVTVRFLRWQESVSCAVP